MDRLPTVHLTVTKPFGAHQRGDVVTDPETVARLLDANVENVVRIVPLPTTALES